MALITTAAIGTTDPVTGITTFSNQPPDALMIGELDTSGGFEPAAQGGLNVAGSPTGPAFDPYEATLVIRQAVVDGFSAQDAANNDSPFLDDPQPADSLVGMRFIDPDNGYSYCYEPVAFANGTFNVWTSSLLSR